MVMRGQADREKIVAVDDGFASVLPYGRIGKRIAQRLDNVISDRGAIVKVGQ
jgi:hypothetical protein